MPGFHRHTPTGVEWRSFTRVNARSIEMTFAEADELIAVTIPRVVGDVALEGCAGIGFELSQCRPVSGPMFIQVRAFGVAPTGSMDETP